MEMRTLLWTGYVTVTGAVDWVTHNFFRKLTTA